MAAQEQSGLDAELRKQIVALLEGGQAHATFEDAVRNLPAELRGVVPEGLPYSAWQLLEHMRIAQRDIVDFSAPPTGGYHGLKWPEQYWPRETAPATADAWERSVAAVKQDLEAFKKLIVRPEADLVKPFRWGTGQNLLREALLVADHGAYHVGELIVLRRVRGAGSEQRDHREHGRYRKSKSQGHRVGGRERKHGVLCGTAVLCRSRELRADPSHAQDNNANALRMRMGRRSGSGSGSLIAMASGLDGQ